MEAARDFIPFEDEGQGTDRGTGRAAGCGVNPGIGPGTDPVARPARASGVDVALAALRDVSATALEDAASWGLKAASDFAGRVEEFSRTVEYLQVVAASAVDRARKQSAADRREGRHVVDDGLARRRPGSAAAFTAAAGGTGVTGVGW